jgi:hypothetical protein
MQNLPLLERTKRGNKVVQEKQERQTDTKSIAFLGAGTKQQEK